MEKPEFENRFNLLINVVSDNDAKKFLTEFRDGALSHIEKLEEEIKVQNEIMEQQVKLIMEMGK